MEKRLLGGFLVTAIALNNSNFGRILTAGAPRIMQPAVTLDF